MNVRMPRKTGALHQTRLNKTAQWEWCGVSETELDLDWKNNKRGRRLHLPRRHAGCYADLTPSRTRNVTNRCDSAHTINRGVLFEPKSAERS